jgi:hypothetical protein
VSCIIFIILISCTPLGAGEAVDENGQLKDASDIVWYHDKEDTVPIASGSRTFGSQFAAGLS